MSAQASIYSKRNSRCLTYQEHNRSQNAIVIGGKTSADLKSRDEAREDHDDRNY